ncbi:SDR family NAD(P)-dependent oxidoreductase [Oxalobacteraceae bacterium CAVE-383]|nr:SDR family NAD(P)-dependent oxidoreductase [Oxalobacteraceae bacterium CAVE-383]
MSFYAITYPIRFEDTMAYGSHHFLTNFRFQCAVRESLLFDHLGRVYPGSRSDYDDVVMLTRDGYSRNLNPAMLGERLAVLLSFAAPTRSSFQLCIRTINEKGEPVACGFQTIVFMDKKGGFVQFPRALDEFAGLHLDLGERLIEPSFAEIALAGGSRLNAVFTPEICALGKSIATQGLELGMLVGQEPAATGPDSAPAPEAVPAALDGDAVLAFPGQGTFDPAQFRLLCQDAGARDLLNAAEPVVQAVLGISLQRLADGPESDIAGILAAAPDLDHFGILLTQLLTARRLLAAGIRPAALFGHSAGEIGALCVAGSFTPETAIRIVAERVRALRQVAGPVGGMLALSAPLARAQALVDEFFPNRPQVHVSVINTPKQTILSGPRASLETLLPVCFERRIGAHLMSNRYAFHSPMLSLPARALAVGLVGLPMQPPQTPVYSPILGRFYGPSDFMPIALASHLTHVVDFPKALDALSALGMRRMIECSPGTVLTDIAKRNAIAGLQPMTAAAAIAAQNAAPANASANLAIASAANSAATSAAIPAALTDPAESAGEAIAIVSMGCVVPGADDAAQLWRNLLEGVSGIVDLRSVDPMLEHDLMGGAQTAIEPDKTYTMLTGMANDVAWRAEFPFPQQTFEGMSKAQRLLAEALRQAGATRNSDTSGGRTLCLLGSTADGIREYDDALFHDGMRHVLNTAALPAALKSAALDALATLNPGAPGQDGDPEQRSPYPAFTSVVRAMLGADVPTVLLDAACASSLYALNLGVQALRAHEADLAYVGGVFSAGPSNTTLFAQFGGLSATGSHAFDRSADGVVFGEGAAVLGIRRLGDAIARGETVLAVVRATGVASDGQSVSVNVPRSAGQLAAMQAAYRSAGIDPQSVHYVEAHATATPVGDATEFEALAALYGGRDPSLPRIQLGSIKSLLGHTGWLAGASSMIKVIQSLRHDVLPPHHGWSAPNPRMDLAASPFNIPTTQQPWPQTPGRPRRAAVNGFGFGGTNAHVVLEAFDPLLHRAMPAAPLADRAHDKGEDIVCVGFGAGFAGSGAELAETAGSRVARINPAAFRMPRRKLLIPDALEQMDANQFTVLAGADRALAASGIDLARWKERIGIVIGSAGKARRGIAANQRILATGAVRKLKTALLAAGCSPADAEIAGGALDNGLKDPVPPSNPYTLVGMMPNLVAGRVANTFNLMGPNLVIDTGQSSLLSAIGVAGSYLRHRISDFVLTGAVNATAPWPRAGLPAGRDGVETDGAALMVLTLRRTAMENGLAILSMVARENGALTLLAPAHDATAAPVTADIRAGRPHEVGGIAALAGAMQALAAGGPAQRLRWLENDAENMAESATADTGAEHDFSDPRPIDFYALTPIPVQVPVSVMLTGTADLPRRILLITDQTGLVKKLQKSTGFTRSAIRVVAPGPAAENQLAQIVADDVDMLLVVRDLAGVPPHALLGAAPKAQAVLDLAFVAARQFRDAIETGGMALLALHLNALPGGQLHADAALIHGMLKSLARDWPNAAVRAIASDGANLNAAAAAVARELKLHAKADPANADVEIIERDGVRHAYRFAPATPGSASALAEKSTQLDAQSVVVLTGGARGVTAVMAEALLERYGCKLVLLGRSDPDSVPPALRAMSLEELDKHEAAYYRDERQRDPQRSIVELKRAFAQLKAAHETADTIARLRRLGHVDYRTVDITDQQQVDAAVGDIVKQLGRITLLVHGAGLQISKHLSKRRLDEFQQVVGTKLNGLRNLAGACNRLAGPDVQFHLLTSAFSAMGNDGQPDYGAANEAMAALARTAQASGWTALGWLGWAAVGMTRASEYMALGNMRGLRAVLPSEGKALFLQMLEGRLASPALSLLSEGERQFYRLQIAREGQEQTKQTEQRHAAIDAAPRASLTHEWRLDLESAPYLRDHVVNGYPTLPGTFEVEFAMQAARLLRPGHAHIAARRPRFHRFVRVPEQGLHLRAEARVIEETADGSVVAVRLLSDFVHRSGAVLQRDVLHFEGEVLTATSCFPLSENPVVAADLNPSVSCADPFLAPGSPVKLGGVFACLDEIRIGPQVRSARFHLGAGKSLQALAGFRSPVLLFDALFRLLGLAPDGDVETGTVSVPIDGGAFRFKPGLTDLALQGQVLTLTAANPRSEGDLLVTDWGQVLDAQGRIIVSIERAVARRMGAPKRAEAPVL